MYDTIIIGAGMSGLAAGIRLAYYGQKVCILERHYTIGGLNSFYRLGGRDYDVGLHAVTNFTPRGEKKGPLARLLRQLRFRWDDFALAEQVGSVVAFPEVELHFGNDFELLRSQIEEKFPAQRANLQRLLDRIVDYDDLDQATFNLSARPILEETLSDPLLIEMLLCPLMWYGNARENDMDWGAFCIMFRSIFFEGFARPQAGVRLILKNLVRKFRSLGGELMLRCGVQKIETEGEQAIGVVLDDGRQLEGRRILSSAGWPETMRMCDESAAAEATSEKRLSFVETISILDRPPKEVGYDRTIVFFNDSEKFHWREPSDFCDLRTGVICSPNNYLYESENPLPDGVLRVTALANFAAWKGLSEADYRVEKLRWFERINGSVARFIPDYRRHIIDHDMFTPQTVQRFTWHDHGAVYGSPTKRLDGKTHLDNVFICGTDQGFVGIVGAILSGITIANQYCLRDAA
jgi:phytoene dehydrogenase-like protein